VSNEAQMAAWITALQRDVADLKRQAQARGAAWNSYTPVMGASVTPPSIGAAGVQAGTWSQTGRKVSGTANWQFGTSGTAAGSGFYLLGLPPVAPASAGVWVGWGTFLDSSAGIYYPLFVAANGGMVTGAGGFVTPTTPVTMGNGDQFLVTWDYQAA
jgi:hypothetical protein